MLGAKLRGHGSCNECIVTALQTALQLLQILPAQYLSLSNTIDYATAANSTSR